MKLLTQKQIKALVNWDGMLSKKPFRNSLEERQYYGRYLGQRLWRYLTAHDWKRIGKIIESIRVPKRTKDATKRLLIKHTRR